MWYMFVTLEVSKLSGWLKAYVFCRVEGRSMRYGARCGPGGGGRAWGGGGGCGMHGEGPTQAGVHGEGPTQGLGGQLRARAGRTKNMKVMTVTLEVSKLSGWLKACAFCRVKGGACDMGRGARPGGGGHGVAAADAACTKKVRLKTWGARARAGRTQNMLIMFVTLEVSKLSGWLNADAYCQVEGRSMRCGAR
jgi:hypothetical protein